jgi:hypothetical protein
MPNKKEESNRQSKRYNTSNMCISRSFHSSDNNVVISSNNGINFPINFGTLRKDYNSESLFRNRRKCNMTWKKLAEIPSKQPTDRHNLQIYSKTSRKQGNDEDELVHPITNIIIGIKAINGKQGNSVTREANMDVSKKSMVKVDSRRTSKPVEYQVEILTFYILQQGTTCAP